MMREQEQDSSLLRLAVRPVLYTAMYCLYMYVQLDIMRYTALITDKRDKGHCPIRCIAIMVSYGTRIAP